MAAETTLVLEALALCVAVLVALRALTARMDDDNTVVVPRTLLFLPLTALFAAGALFVFSTSALAARPSAFVPWLPGRAA